MFKSHARVYQENLGFRSVYKAFYNKLKSTTEMPHNFSSEGSLQGFEAFQTKRKTWQSPSWLKT